MSYRVAPPREADPPEPPHVLEIRRYGWVWLGFIAAVALVLTAFGASTYHRSVLRCDRASTGAKPACALVVEGFFATEREAVSPQPWSVHTQDALIGDEGMQPHLGVHLEGGGLRWFQLGPRNQVVEAAFAAWLASPAPAPFEQQLTADRANLVVLPLVGVVALVLVLALESLQRIEVDRASGIVRVTKRGLFGNVASEMRYHLDEVERVDTEQQGDGEIYSVVFVQGSRKRPVVDGRDGAASKISEELERLRQERADRAQKERQGQLPGSPPQL